MTTPIHIRAYRLLRRTLPQKWVFQLSSKALLAQNLIKYRDHTMPMMIGIEITSHCNRHCAYCPQSLDHLKPRWIDPITFNQILERIAELDWSGMVSFNHFNEPTMDKHLEDRVAATRKALPKASLVLYTNADALDEARMHKLIAAGMTKFQITRHPPFTQKWDDRILPLAEKYPQYISCHVIEGTALYTQTGIIKPANRVDLSKGCHQTASQMTITIDGDYLFCCCDYNKTEIMGNVFKQPILRAWNRMKYKQARASVRQGVPVLDVCKKCFEE